MASAIIEQASMATNDLNLTDLVTSAVNDGTVGSSDDGVTEELTTPKAKVTNKKGRAPKKTAVKDEAADEVESAPPATSSTGKTTGTNKKRGGEAGDGDTPTKKPKATNPKAPKAPKTPKTPKSPKGKGATSAKKGPNAKFPTSAAEFSEEDRLIVNLKKQGKNWKFIETEWEKLTGRAPGDSTIRKRWVKLDIVDQGFKDADTLNLLQAYKQAQEESAAALKKLENEKWAKTASLMKDLGTADEYKPGAVEKKYKELKLAGSINEKGDYVGPALPTADANDIAGEEAENETDETANENVDDEEEIDGGGEDI